MSDATLTVAERFYAAIDSEDVDAILALCGDDIDVAYPGAGRLAYGGHWSGHDGVASFLDAHDAAEEILEFEVDRMLADEATVAVFGTFRGRAKPRGGEWSTRFVHDLTINGGLVRRWEAYFDTAAAVAAHVAQGTAD